MTTTLLFATPLHRSEMLDADRLDELSDTIRYLADEDEAGQAWAEQKGYRGYTSYASLDDLVTRDPVIGDLKPLLTRRARTFAKELGWDHKPTLDHLWVNLMEAGAHHTSHLHPHSVLSGTLYIEVPDGAGAIRFEDPRHAMMMAAPVRSDDAPEHLQPFVTVTPRAGTLLLWESFLRHEVLPHPGPGERLSISFNFA